MFIFVVDLCGHCFDMSEQAARVELVHIKNITEHARENLTITSIL